MRRINIAAALVAVSLALSGCAGTRVGEVIQFATASVANPVTSTNIYQAENAYAAALTLADEWRTYCWARPYRVLLADPIAKQVCWRRRPVLRNILNYGPKARTALAQAKAFVRDHPTLDASLMIRAAIAAVAKFREVVPATK
jgi:hypothetical protein